MKNQIIELTNKYVENSDKNIDVNNMDVVRDFHNFLLTTILGEPDKIYNGNQPTTNQNNAWVKSGIKNTDIKIDVIEFTSLYVGVAAGGQCGFNYTSYPELLRNVVSARKEFKANSKHTPQTLLKTFVNYSYFAYEFSGSILNGSRDCISNTARKIVDEVIGFLEHNGIDILYYDTDMLFTSPIPEELSVKLLNYYNNELGYLVDTSISTLEFDKNKTVNIEKVKKYTFKD